MEIEQQRRRRVLAEIRQRQARKKQEAADRYQVKYGIHGEQGAYLHALDQCLKIIPTKGKIPKKWTSEAAFQEASAKARIIMNRLKGLGA